MVRVNKVNNTIKKVTEGLRFGSQRATIMTTWRIIIICLLVFILGVPLVAVASDISDANFYGTVIVSNNSTAETNVSTVFTANATAMIYADFMFSSGNNTAIRTSSGADIPYMPGLEGNPWCLWVPAIGDYSYISDILYVGGTTDMAGEIRYFPNTAGMDSSDSASLEPGGNFTIEQKGRFDISSINNTLIKPAAYRIAILDSGNITAGSPFSALRFDGITDYATQPTLLDVSAPDDFTLDFWFKPAENFITGNPTQYLFYKTNIALADRIGGALVSGDGTFTVYLEYNNDGLIALSSDANTWNGNQWYYAAITYSGSTDNTWRMYIDSVLQADTEVKNGFMRNGTSSDFILGASDGAGATSCNTTIDEVRLSSVVRTQQDIDNVWMGGTGNSTITDADTLCLWHLDDGRGIIFYDETANNYDGTIANDTHWDDGVWGAYFPPVFTDVLTSGEYTITVSANTTTHRIQVDGSTHDTFPSGGRSVANNTDNWTFCADGTMPYLEYQQITIGGTLRQYISWEFDTVFTDLSGNGNSTAPTFRGDSSDEHVSAALSAFTPISESKAPDYVLGLAPDFIDAGALTSNITGEFSTVPATGNGTFPLAGVITSVAVATSTPPQLPLLIIAVFIILAVSLTISAVMRKHGSGSLIPKVIAIVAVMGIFVALGNFAIDFWMIFIFVLVAIAIAFASKQLGWA